MKAEAETAAPSSVVVSTNQKPTAIHLPMLISFTVLTSTSIHSTKTHTQQTENRFGRKLLPSIIHRRCKA